MSAAAMSGWTRFLGITLRPWAGHSPWSLLLRGAIQVGISAFFFVLMARFAAGDGFTATAQEMTALRQLAFPVMIVVALMAGLGLFQLVIGALDLVPRRQVTGTVVDVRERRLGDFLPMPLQRMVFERNPQSIDRRRYRTEVVLDTPDGRRQWTVRSHSVRRALRRGAHVRLSVTPLAGYIAGVQHMGP